MAVDVKFAQDTLRGDSVTEIRMKFIKRIEENLPAGDEWQKDFPEPFLFHFYIHENMEVTSNQLKGRWKKNKSDDEIQKWLNLFLQLVWERWMSLF